MGFMTNCSVAGDGGSCLITWNKAPNSFGAFSCTETVLNRGTDAFDRRGPLNLDRDLALDLNRSYVAEIKIR